MNADGKLDLRPGEWVEVRSEAEIMATLDDDGALDGLVFMPEMLKYCGLRYQVFKRADRTCDTVKQSGMRRMLDTVHLNTVRCDGCAHDGCQALCLIFWKEAWLRRAADVDGQAPASAAPPAATTNGHAARGRAWLEGMTRHEPASDGATQYRCQMTEVNGASTPLPWWEPTQYARDIVKNGEPIHRVIRAILLAILNAFLKRITGGAYPNVFGRLKRTPSESLDLQPGEWVIVKSKEEILATLDKTGRNRGMTFEAEMVPYCGKRYRVLRRVDQIIDEPTGRMRKLNSPSIILETVICASFYRRACPRANYLFWREIWLRRAEPEETAEDAQSNTACLQSAQSG